MDNAKIEQLRQYLMIQQEAQRLTQEIERWYSVAEKVTPSLTATRFTVPDGSRLENAIEQIDTLRDTLGDRLQDLIKCRRQIEFAIESVSDPRLRMLLRYRYIDGMTWEALAGKMGISPQWAQKLHKIALELMTVDCSLQSSSATL